MLEDRRTLPLVPSSEQTDRRLDALVTEHELVELVNREDAIVPTAVAAAGDELAAAIDAIVAKLQAGGRLVYVGAGSSGRLAELDASECESTFSTEPGRVVALVAGAGLGTTAELDAAEDDSEAGAAAVASIRVSSRDAVVGVSASGRTRYVIGALEAAAAAGALTVCVVSVPDSELARIADHEVAVVVGPEVISGSTRLKAGTAQKLVLNSISTLSMVRLGKTYGDLMVDVAGTNEKQRVRARRAVRLATGAGDEAVDDALAAAEGSAKVAIVSLLARVDAETARVRLRENAGSIRKALE
ncbi:MAG: N-acetylmuramic acid 6-phosphate etherase [Actinobacteria bacterium]|nr:MAG: N-acetylmuramic acid 6-phosphate etherase [Actinomycetota bacterium]